MDRIDLESVSRQDNKLLDVRPMLVISADPAQCESIAETIRKCSLPLVRCQSLCEAQALLQQQNFSVVFCTDILPDGDFRAALKAVKQSHSNSPVVVLSRLAEWDAYLGALSAGAFDYIACPPNAAETLRVLWCALSRSIGPGWAAAWAAS